MSDCGVVVAMGLLNGALKRGCVMMTIIITITENNSDKMQAHLWYQERHAVRRTCLHFGTVLATSLTLTPYTCRCCILVKKNNNEASGVEKKRSSLRQDPEAFIYKSLVLSSHMRVCALNFGAALCLELMRSGRVVFSTAGLLRHSIVSITF